jgi:hypothetical protein
MAGGATGEARMSRKEPEKAAAKNGLAELRRQRLADALKANLKRRKAAKPPKTHGNPKTAGD